MPCIATKLGDIALISIAGAPLACGPVVEPPIHDTSGSSGEAVSSSEAETTSPGETTQDTAAATTTATTGPPVIELLTAMPVAISEGQLTTIVAVVHDPDGPEDIASALLRSDDGLETFASFEHMSGDTWLALLGWDEIHAAESINFVDQDARFFRVEFTDRLGSASADFVEVGLVCNGVGACHGECTPLDTIDHCGGCEITCPADNDCAAGRCTPRCGDGDIDPGEQCDGDDLQGLDCDSLGLGSGTLACATNCTFDTSGCNP